jgi:arylformamidase
MPELIDISPPLSSRLAVWPGDTPFAREIQQRIAAGDGVDLSAIRTTVHAGAHADAPSHFMPGGECIDRRPLERYYGPCRVIRVDIAPGTRLLPEDVTDPIDAPRILFRTDTFIDRERFDPGFAALSPELMAWLAGQGVGLVGLDTPSVDLFDDGSLVAHREAGRRDLALLEGLELSGVAPGRYTLIALPLRIEGADGAPVRAALAPAV